MTSGRRVPSLIWLVGGGVAGVALGGAISAGLTARARSSATTVWELHRANETITWIGVLTALSLLALGVFVDAQLFRRRGQPIAGITWDGSWWQRLIAAVIWPAFVAGMLVIGLPAYCYMRAQAVAQIRGPDTPRTSPLLGLVLGFVGVVVGVGATSATISATTRLLPSDSFVTDAATDHEASDWAAAHGRNVEVTCDRGSILHVGDSFGCYGIGSDDKDVVRITGIVADAAGRTDWRFSS